MRKIAAMTAILSIAAATGSAEAKVHTCHSSSADNVQV
ncbi:MAG: hypothetical protein QOE60_138, partial [Thermoleophilaceae bacterium]|nr:hypothetical protein [Thermoleophilaceae bacterium]